MEITEYGSYKHASVYPYRRPPSQGPGVAPAAILNKKSPKKTIDGKIRQWFRKYKDMDQVYTDLFDDVANFIEENIDAIDNKVANSIQEFKRKESFLLTVDFRDSKISQDFRNFVKNGFYANVNEKYHTRYGVTSLGNGECFHCGKSKEVLAFTSPFQFYTHDKVTYAPGFDRRYVWKQYPVCMDCALIVELGAAFIRDQFSYLFNGIPYLLFPKFINVRGMSETLDELINAYENRKKTLAKGSKINK